MRGDPRKGGASGVVKFLAGLTFAEGSVAALAAALLLLGYWAEPRPTPLCPVLLGLALSFGVAMAFAGRRLWRGDPQGLAVLLLVLAGEFEFLFGLPHGLLIFGLHSAVVAAYTSANTPALLSATPQMYTGYPVLAVAFFYPAYRALVSGPTAREPDRSPGPRPIEGSRTIPRALAALIVLEVLAGLVRVAPVLEALRESSADPLFYGYQHVAAVGRLAMGVNALFDVALLAAVVPLLRARRVGFAVLMWTLAAEFLYYTAVPMLFLLEGVGRPPPFLGPAMALKVGDFALQVQFLTAFPVIAVALLLVALRGAHGRESIVAVPGSPGNGESRARSATPRGGRAEARRLKVVVRALAALTMLEAAVSLLQLRPSWATATSQLATRLGVRTTGLAAFWLDAASGLALIFSAVLLWRQNRAGLRAISLTIIAECALWSFFPFLPGQLLGSYARPAPMALVPFRGVGNLFLGVQILTAFPVVAAVLIILASRYRAILASSPEGRAADAGPAMAAWKAMVAMRLLAAVTLLEAAAGLARARLAPVSFGPPPSRLPPLLAAEATRFASLGASKAYAILGVDVTLSVLLVGCAVLLWLQSRWGLAGVIAILLAELAGVVAAAVTGLPLMGFPDPAPGLSAQILTAYPLVAALLLYLAHRWRRKSRAEAA